MKMNSQTPELEDELIGHVYADFVRRPDGEITVKYGFTSYNLRVVDNCAGGMEISELAIFLSLIPVEKPDECFENMPHEEIEAHLTDKGYVKIMPLGQTGFQNLRDAVRESYRRQVTEEIFKVVK